MCDVLRADPTKSNQHHKLVFRICDFGNGTFPCIYIYIDPGRFEDLVRWGQLCLTNVNVAITNLHVIKYQMSHLKTHGFFVGYI